MKETPNKSNLSQTAQKEKIRNSNLELLRIVSIILIIMHHLAVHGLEGSEITYFNNSYLYIKRFFEIGGKLGVILFILTSGYFLIESKFNLRKLFKIIFQTIFYNVILYLLAIALNVQSFTAINFIKSFFPILTNQYWFVTNYVILYLLSPFINKMIKSINRNEHLWLIAILTFLQCLQPLIFNVNLLSPLVWFINIYIIAAFLRLYQPQFLKNKTRLVMISTFTFFIIAFVNMFVTTQNHNISWEMTSILCLICAISIFCLFNTFNIKNNKFINIIASTTFGIYLLHDNNYFRNFIWKTIFNCPYYASIKLFPLFAVLSVIIVFVVCSLIDLLRLQLDRLLNKIVSYFKTKKLKSKNSKNDEV